jgi:hypothetical protein
MESLAIQLIWKRIDFPTVVPYAEPNGVLVILSGIYTQHLKKFVSKQATKNFIFSCAC